MRFLALLAFAIALLTHSVEALPLEDTALMSLAIPTEGALASLLETSDSASRCQPLNICAVVTFGDRTQSEFGNTRCTRLKDDAWAVYVNKCTCGFYK